MLLQNSSSLFPVCLCCVAKFEFMSPLQKLTTEHTERTERVRFMNKRIIFWRLAHVIKIFTVLFLMKYKIIFSLCDLRGLCGEKITFLQ